MPINRHNQALITKLQALLTNNNAEVFYKSLCALSHSERRTASHLLSTVVLPEASDEAFRSTFLMLSRTEPKAYRVTCLKAACIRYENHKFNLYDPLLAEYAQGNPSSIDCNKVLTHLLPIAQTPEEATYLLNLFAPSGVRLRMAHLLRCTSLPAAYALFTEAQFAESDSQLLQEACVALHRRGDTVGKRLASLLQAYFSLPPLSLAQPLLQPYQLSRLEGGYEAFLKIIKE